MQKFTLCVAIKRPHGVDGMEGKLKVIKNYRGGKSVTVTACQSGVSHTVIPTVLKNKNKVTEAVRESVSYKAIREKKIEKGLCHHKETSSDLK